ncbi:hypothetical protein J4558_20145 [Leptolyngbya sp. 15MV]|nr:hypothetical protein J4558_20145 [Leptolyngbya sp. 15MV]
MLDIDDKKVLALTLWQVFGVLWEAGGQTAMDYFKVDWPNYVFGVLSAPMFFITMGLTGYLLAAWFISIREARRDAGVREKPRFWPIVVGTFALAAVALAAVLLFKLL